MSLSIVVEVFFSSCEEPKVNIVEVQYVLVDVKD